MHLGRYIYGIFKFNIWHVYSLEILVTNTFTEEDLAGLKTTIAESKETYFRTINFYFYTSS